MVAILYCKLLVSLLYCIKVCAHRSSPYTIHPSLRAQIKDAVRDGLRAVTNTVNDESVIPGAGAYEVSLAHHLRTVTKKKVQGRAKLGIEAFAEALMGFPKILAENSGHDQQVSTCRGTHMGFHVLLAENLGLNRM